MATRTERITEVLRALRGSAVDIIGASVVSREGLTIASVAPPELDQDLVGGMSAALLGVGERISGELMRAPMEQTVVRSERGYVIVNAIGADAVLVLLVNREAKLGLIFLELNRTVPELHKAL